MRLPQPVIEDRPSSSRILGANANTMIVLNGLTTQLIPHGDGDPERTPWPPDATPKSTFMSIGTIIRKISTRLGH